MRVSVDRASFCKNHFIMTSIFASMGNLNVAMIGPIDYAKDLAKKGTSTDITLYDIKKDQDTVTLIEPTKYPESDRSLFYSVSMANVALVVVDEINAQLGECILMLDCAGVDQGFFILRNYITPDKIAPFIKGTRLEKYQYIENNPVEIREMLYGYGHQGPAGHVTRRRSGPSRSITISTSREWARSSWAMWRPAALRSTRRSRFSPPPKSASSQVHTEAR